MDKKLEFLKELSKIKYTDKLEYLSYLSKISKYISSLRIELDNYIEVKRNYPDNIVTVEEILKDVEMALELKNEVLKQSYLKRANDLLIYKYKFTAMYRGSENFTTIGNI